MFPYKCAVWLIHCLGYQSYTVLFVNFLRKINEFDILYNSFFCSHSIGLSVNACENTAFIKKEVCQNAHLFFYAQSPDFHKQGLCYYLKILYL